MSKYDPLRKYLGQISDNQWPATFKQIERVLGFPLPSSARRYNIWWWNSRGRGRQSAAWLDAGWEAEELDLQKERVVFRRVAPRGAKTIDEVRSVDDIADFDALDIGRGDTYRGKTGIRSKAQVIFYSRAIIAALEEALEYDPARHHNSLPSGLYINDADYLQVLRDLVAELRKLNDGLSRRKALPRKSTIDVKKHLNTFLEKYVGTVGKGMGALTVASIGGLVYQLGAGEIVFEKLGSIVRAGR